MYLILDIGVEKDSPRTTIVVTECKERNLRLLQEEKEYNKNYSIRKKIIMSISSID